MVKVAACAGEVVLTVVLGKDSAEVSVAADVATAVTLSVAELEVPPPGAGLVTVIAGKPAAATSVDRIAAVSCVELT